MPESPEERAARIAGEFYAFSPGEFMDAREAESDRRRRTPVDWPYNWPALIAIAAIVIVLLWCFWSAFSTPTQAAEQGPAGSTIPPFCRSHDQAMTYVTSPPYSEELWRLKSAYFPSGKPAGVVEWTENRETGTWTVLVSRHGLTCILFSGGKEWERS